MKWKDMSDDMKNTNLKYFILGAVVTNIVYAIELLFHYLEG